MLGIIAIYEILQDGTALKETDGGAISKSVSERRNPAIGVDFKEPWLLKGGGFGQLPMALSRLIRGFFFL